MKKALIFLTIIVIVYISHATVLLHDYDLNTDFSDNLNGGGQLTVNPATDSHGFDGNEWWWQGTNHPGGGLILLANLSDPSSYTLAFTMKFDVIGNSWRKIISFRGTADDNGLYFYNNNLQLYPYSAQTNLSYQSGVYYDFVFTRNPAGDFKVYTVDNGVVTLVFDQTAASTDITTPINVNNLYEFRLFTDDTHTSGEFAPSGSIRNLRVWDSALSSAEIGTALAEANFTSDVTVISPGDTVSFTDISSGNPTSWYWDFENDGTYDSTTQNPAFAYNVSGIYDVKLKIVNTEVTDSIIKSEYIACVNEDSTVTNLQIGTDGDDVVLNWDNDVSDYMYFVYISDSPDSNWQFLTTITGTNTYTHENALVNSRKKFYTVLKLRRN